MSVRPDRFLLAAATVDVAAALAHYACIVVGADAYRFLGAGERLARMAERGDAHPHLMAAGIGTLLLVWAWYALSGAGVVRRLPLTRTALAAIATLLLLRAVAFVPLQSYFPGNSRAFWLTSSAICVGLGLLHALGLSRVWPALRQQQVPADRGSALRRR